MFEFDTGDYAISTADNVVQSRAVWVSEDFWTVSGARPMLGHLPRHGEDAILLSHQFFVRAFMRTPLSQGVRPPSTAARSRSPAYCLQAFACS